MAAPRRSSQGAGSGSSSDEDEALERFREATWKPPCERADKLVKCQQDPVPTVLPSLRTQPDYHEHDGNELQTTPEFRTHVAKKLAAMLDSCIKDITKTSSLKSKEASNSEDEGFRLFRTSVPGDSGTVVSNSIPKRKVASSTSEDSEEEKQRRFCEAAVSGLDILKHSALQPALAESLDTVCNNQLKKKCKKKKKKKKEDRGLDIEVASDDQNTAAESRKKVPKKKKKKVTLENTDELGDR